MTRSIDDFVAIGPWKAGAIPEPYTHTFTDDDGNPIWLGTEGWRAEFWFRRLGSDTELGGECTIEAQGEAGAEAPPATLGQVTYTWVDGDLDERGVYVGVIWVGDEDERRASDELRWEVQAAPAAAPDLSPIS